MRTLRSKGGRYYGSYEDWARVLGGGSPAILQAAHRVRSALGGTCLVAQVSRDAVDRQGGQGIRDDALIKLHAMAV